MGRHVDSFPVFDGGRDLMLTALAIAKDKFEPVRLRVPSERNAAAVGKNFAASFDWTSSARGRGLVKTGKSVRGHGISRIRRIPQRRTPREGDPKLRAPGEPSC